METIFDTELLELDLAIKDLLDTSKSIVLYNDEVNSFEHVIDCLVKYCRHAETQAHQCALIVHTKGKYAVKNGDLDTLKPIKEALCENGLTATIE